MNALKGGGDFEDIPGFDIRVGAGEWAINIGISMY
jgi:hypothetical protein